MAKKIEKQISPETQKLVDEGKVPRAKVDRYFGLLDRIEKEVLTHEVIVNNEYTAWFRQGKIDRDDVRHFLVQFSVFSNLFIEAQLRKTLNAPTLEAMHTSKEILLNELGVVFRNPKGKSAPSASDKTAEVEPDLVGTEGTVDGGTFRFRAAHFEWLLRMVDNLGLKFGDVGKRRHGTPSTLRFCDDLSRIYGSDDTSIGLGASFGVENWAAAGFWKELIAGLTAFKNRECPTLSLAYFTWHDRVEDQHAAHTWDELEEEYFEMDLDEEKFLDGAKEMLDGVLAFWKGLDADRRQRNNERKVG